jgi:hypothetical protein
MDNFLTIWAQIFFFFLKKSSDGFKSTYKTKKRKEKILDVKLLSTDRTTVQEDIPYHLKIGRPLYFYLLVHAVYRRVYILLCCCCWPPLIKLGTISADSWSNMIKHDQTWSETWSDMIRNLIRHDQAWSDMIRRDQTWSDVIRHDQTW